jgi:hypothetical protein
MVGLNIVANVVTGSQHFGCAVNYRRAVLFGSCWIDTNTATLTVHLDGGHVAEYCVLPVAALLSRN